MNKAIKDLINEAFIKIIKNSGDDGKLKALIEKHDKKLHFIPKRYRIFGGILTGGDNAFHRKFQNKPNI